jgi:chaperone required for assembly of F1-ATPase
MRKRFFQGAGVEERGEACLIALDGKPAKTRAGALLAVPTRALAEAIAQEWNRQGKRISPADMPLTALANLAIDHVGAQRGEVIEHVLGFGRSDLVCYGAGEAELAARQKALWDPLLQWAQVAHAIRLVTDCGVTFIEQPVDALLRMQEIVSWLDDFTLAAFHAAAALTGSFVLPLALVEGRLDAEAAFTAAQIDELYQAEKWGRDAQAESRRACMLSELKAIEHFVRLLQAA